MRKFIRQPCPSVLLEPFSKKNTKPRWVIYGERYENKRIDRTITIPKLITRN